MCTWTVFLQNKALHSFVRQFLYILCIWQYWLQTFRHSSEACNCRTHLIISYRIIQTETFKGLYYAEISDSFAAELWRPRTAFMILTSFFGEGRLDCDTLLFSLIKWVFICLVLVNLQNCNTSNCSRASDCIMLWPGPPNTALCHKESSWLYSIHRYLSSGESIFYF